MLRILRNFWNDQRGIALILVSITLPAIIGFSLLAIDMSRANNLHNDLQNGADSFSIAAAAELDGKQDSITRADRALTTLVSNEYDFSTEGTVPGPQPLAAAGVTRRYLRSLPATDNLPITNANVIADEITDASDARFIEVRVTPVGFAAIFPVSFLSAGSSGIWTIGATSVAGFKSGVCDFTPMFICNPYSNMDVFSATLAGDSRPMMLLKKQTGGATAAYGPGNYGFLQTPDGDMSVPRVKEMFASPKPLACYSNDGVDTRPGNIPPINDAINVRFDIYPNGSLNPANYPPAPNTRKGLAVKNAGKPSCTYEAPSAAQASQYKPLPRDNCFTAGTCTVPSGGANSRLGDGSWDRAGYWAVNHPSTSYGSTGLPANASRYEVYKWELNNLTDHGTEATTPACNTPSTDMKRRMVYAAMLDCDPSDGSGQTVSGSGGNYPVESFISIFLTEPAGDAPDADIYGEIVDITGRGGSGSLDNFLRDEAQLYR
ncbi:pilus assembly protein TadG-related protein [Mesorhizobium sp. M1409]|uniref:pilus assembly protein TadG-related protein n=1 Tax=Mesorhizobium sp. M1409 TaxID=2957100 RepID=UPI00333A0E1B